MDESDGELEPLAAAPSVAPVPCVPPPPTSAPPPRVRPPANGDSAAAAAPSRKRRHPDSLKSPAAAPSSRKKYTAAARQSDVEGVFWVTDASNWRVSLRGVYGGVFAKLEDAERAGRALALKVRQAKHVPYSEAERQQVCLTGRQIRQKAKSAVVPDFTDLVSVSTWNRSLKATTTQWSHHLPGCKECSEQLETFNAVSAAVEDSSLGSGTGWRAKPQEYMVGPSTRTGAASRGQSTGFEGAEFIGFGMHAEGTMHWRSRPGGSEGRLAASFGTDCTYLYTRNGWF